MMKTTKQPSEHTVSFALKLTTSEHFKKIKFQHVNFKLYFALFGKWRVKVSLHLQLHIYRCESVYTQRMTMCQECVCRRDGTRERDMIFSNWDRNHTHKAYGMKYTACLSNCTTKYRIFNNLRHHRWRIHNLTLRLRLSSSAFAVHIFTL